MATRRPLVLITTASHQRETGLRRKDALTGVNYSAALHAEGLLPVMVANVAPEAAEALAARADGVLFSGGADLGPEHYGRAPEAGLGLVDPDRDAFELALYRAARERGLPILGICRGLQLVNVAEGGTLHQHLGDVDGMQQHEQRNLDAPPFHGLRLEPDSSAALAAGSERVFVNSAHHQGLDQLARGLRACARADDGLVEAVEALRGRWLLAVQWHPEMNYATHPEQRWPFRAFAAALAAAGRERAPPTGG
jgi:putative glutamine amidotransferase